MNKDKTTSKKIGLFDFVSAISENKSYMFDENDSSQYAPFMVNRAFMQHMDTVLLASEMNKAPHLSKLMHHDFLYYSIDAKKRYGKWAKSSMDDEDLIEFLKIKYSINTNNAVEYLELCDRDELKLELKKSMNTGGTK